MESDRRKQSSNTSRIMIPGLQSLEIWDAMTPRGRLWDHMYKPNFPELLKWLLESLRQGGTGEFQEPICANYDSLFIGGGGALNKELIAVIRTLPTPVFLAEDPRFAGERGGRALLAEHGLGGIVMDIGQSSIKLSTKSIRRLYERDKTQLPMGDTVKSAAIPDYLQAFYEYAGQGIQANIETDGPPAGLVLALPCRISPEGTPAECSYAGTLGNRELVQNILKAGGIEKTQTILLNDAELVGYTARLDPRLRGYRKTLVITLGFGVGAALLTRER